MSNHITLKGAQSFNDICSQHWEWVDAMGWHNKTPLESLALIASEVGEAVNECRGDTPTDNFGEELADICLRVFDLALCEGVDLERMILDKITKNRNKGNYKNRSC